MNDYDWFGAVTSARVVFTSIELSMGRKPRLAAFNSIAIFAAEGKA